MAARSPRRTFATPFVVTIAAAAVPAAACYVESRPAATGPGTTPSSAIGGTPTTSTTSTTGTGTPTTNQPATGQGPGDTLVVANPPRPQPQPQVSPDPAPSKDNRWTVMKTGGKCAAHVEVTCPQGALCNPPPPKAYTCLPAMAEGDTIKIVQKDGVGDCFTEPRMPECPAGASCNPPRPQKVACPK